MVSAKLYVRVAQLVTAGTGVLMVDGSYSGGGIRVELVGVCQPAMSMALAFWFSKVL